MSGRRAAVPGGVFGKRPTALEKLTGAGATSGPTTSQQNSDTVIPSDGGTVRPQHGDTAAPSDGDTVAAPGHKAGKAGAEKTTFYLRPDQLDKLDELAYTYKKRTGRRIDRQDIVRTLIDRCDLATLLADG